MNDYQIIGLSVNPIPWRVPPMKVGRGRGGKGTYVQAGRDQELFAYQEAIREELARIGARMMDPPYRIRFWFWRRLDPQVTESGRKSNMHRVDATNMQKATEDALQGLVIGNDADVVDVRSIIVDQDPTTTPGVVIEIWGGVEKHPLLPFSINDAYVTAIDEATMKPAADLNEWPGGGW